MNSGLHIPFKAFAVSELRARLESLGVIIVRCDPEKRELYAYDNNPNALAAILTRSETFRRALWPRDKHLEQRIETLEHVREVLPGFWVSLMPPVGLIESAPRPIAVIPTLPALGNDVLETICAEANAPFEPARRLVAALPPASPLETPRLFGMARLACDQHAAWASEHREALATNIDLQEVGDERDFLYRLVRTMTAHHEPTQYSLVVCNELAAALPYRRICIQFAESDPRLHQLNGQFICAGGGRLVERRCGEAARHVNRLTTRCSPWVASENTIADFQSIAPIGDELIIQPIPANHAKDASIGVIIAADRIGVPASNPNALALDLKLLGAAASHISLYLANAGLDEDINSMFIGALEAITSSIDAKDRMTCGHSQRVSELTRMLGKAIGFDEESCARFHVAGLVHDVGKIGVPEHVLAKPGKLDDGEFDMIRQHPEIGHQILQDIPHLDDILPGVLHHHERWDGRGYPHRIKGENIPLIARMIALADSFDAMSCTRSYRPSLSRDEVLEEIRQNAGSQFDPDLAEAFLKLDFDHFDDLIEEQQISEAA